MIGLIMVKLLLLTAVLVLFVGMVSANGSSGDTVCGDCLVDDFFSLHESLTSNFYRSIIFINSGYHYGWSYTCDSIEELIINGNASLIKASLFGG